MKKLLLILLILSFNIHALEISNYKIFNTKSGNFITKKSLIDFIPYESNIILSESHYTQTIQMAQGKLIQEIVKNKRQDFSVYWEFLVTQNQESINNFFQKLKNNEYTMEDFFKNIFPKGDLERNLIYSPIIESIIKYNGQLFAANAPRSIKRKITKNGLASLSNEEIPYNMEIGSDSYLERFNLAMRDHVPSGKIPYYFQAQSYTDSFMANSLTHFSNTPIKFLIVGSFHADYNDAVVDQIKKISSRDTVNIKIVKVVDFNATSLKPYTTPHPSYGVVADYIYFVKSAEQ